MPTNKAANQNSLSLTKRVEYNNDAVYMRSTTIIFCVNNFLRYKLDLLIEKV